MKFVEEFNELKDHNGLYYQKTITNELSNSGLVNGGKFGLPTKVNYAFLGAFKISRFFLTLSNI